MMISLNLIPYMTIEDVIKNQISKQQLRRMLVLLLAQTISWFRFFAIAITGSQWVKVFLLEYFNYEINHRAFHMATSFLMASPTSLCKCLVLSLCFQQQI